MGNSMTVSWTPPTMPPKNFLLLYLDVLLISIENQKNKNKNSVCIHIYSYIFWKVSPENKKKEILLGFCNLQRQDFTQEENIKAKIKNVAVSSKTKYCGTLLKKRLIILSFFNKLHFKKRLIIVFFFCLLWKLRMKIIMRNKEKE